MDSPDMRARHGATEQGLRLGIALQVGHWNPGDAFPTYVARTLLSEALNPLSLDSWFLHEAAPLNLPGFEFMPYAVSAVICTPWLWDQGHASPKYDILRTFNRTIAAPKRIAVGIGSSFLLHHLARGESVPGQTEIRACAADWQGFDLVICRDRLAGTLLAEVLPPERIKLLPCPSFYSASVFDVSPDPQADHVLVYAQLTQENYWGARDAHIAAADRFQDELVRSGVAVMTMMDRDRQAVEARYGRKPDVDVRAPGDILRAIAQYRNLTSPRVHACMPALSLGLETQIIPLDSRALTAIAVGAKPVAVPLSLMAPFLAPIEPVTMGEYTSILSGAMT